LIRNYNIQAVLLQFTKAIYHLVFVLFVFQHQKYGTPYFLTICSLKHSLYVDVI